MIYEHIICYLLQTQFRIIKCLAGLLGQTLNMPTPVVCKLDFIFYPNLQKQKNEFHVF